MSGIVYLPFYLFTGQHPLPFTSPPPLLFSTFSSCSRNSWRVFLPLLDSRPGSWRPFCSLLILSPAIWARRLRLHLHFQVYPHLYVNVSICPPVYPAPSSPRHCMDMWPCVLLGAAKLSSGATRERTCEQAPTWPTGCSGFIPAEGVPLRHPFIFGGGGSFVCTRGSFFCVYVYVGYFIGIILYV